MRSAAIAVVAITLAVAALPANAVTWMTVNGATSGTINTPRNITMRCDTSTGARVRFVLGSDLDSSGQLEAGEPVLVGISSVRDGSWTDEEPASGVLQVTEYLPIRVGGSVVVQAVDQDGTTVGHGFSLNYTHPAQSVSGTVLYDDGTPAAGVAVAAITEGEPAAMYFTNAAGNYALFLQPGQHAIGALPNIEGAFSRSLRGVPVLDWIDLSAGEAKTGLNFTMHVGSGPDIAGTVTEGDTSRPVPGALVETWDTSTGEQVAAFTDIAGNYSLRVFPGDWNVGTWVEAHGPYGRPTGKLVTVGSSDVTVNFSLPRYANRVYGIVTGPGGVVPPDAWVWAKLPTQGTEQFEIPVNGAGRYELWLPGGTYYVAPFDEGGHYTLLMTDVALVTVPGDQRRDFSMQSCPYTVSGRVTFTGTSTGMPWTELYLEETGGTYVGGFYTTTDGQGYYAVHVPAGTFNGYAYNWMYEAGAGPVMIPFPPGQSSVDIELTPSHSAPTLSAAAVDPVSGGIGGQVFTFSVTYTSADDTGPNDVYVVIDGWPRPMAPADEGDGDFTDGNAYSYETTLSSGGHSFYFGALDWNMLEARLPTSGTLSVTAQPGGTIAGTVTVAGAGTPVAGALVEAMSGAIALGSDTTDATGAYSVALQPGTYSMIVSAPGYIKTTRSSVTVVADQTNTQNFALSQSAIITGWVIADPDGIMSAQGRALVTPLPGTLVEAKLGGVVRGSAYTDEWATYRIDTNLPAGSYTIVASKRYYDTFAYDGVTLTPGETVEQNFGLSPTGELKGQVRIAGTTTNIVGAEVTAYLGTTPVASGTTAANGIYEITQKLREGNYTVVASGDGFLSQTKISIFVTEGATSYCNFNLSASGTLMGQVKAKAASTPINGAQVEAYLGGALKATAWTGPNGVYTLARDLPTGSYVVKASKAGYVSQTKAGIGVTEGSTSYCNFFLDQSGALKGQVRVAGTTTTIAGATVTAYVDDEVKGVATTDASGIYEIAANLPPGLYKVAAAKSGYVRQTKWNITVTAGVTTFVNFALEVSGTLKGQVRDATADAPLAGATVDVFDYGAVWTSGTSQPPYGIYEINQDLATGSYLVRASKTGYVRQYKFGVGITSGSTTFVNFSLERSGKLRGQVKDGVSGTPIVGATVVARSGGVMWATATTTAPWGIYEMDSDLPPATYVVGASKSGYLGQTRKDIPVAGGATTYVNFNLQPQ
ncbi:MAG: carboxypeptidase regulatory-like domain-containing protein [Armatimonadota bacterium]|nr:MAG: carboxypeptidase regulatory-like domain-containing protein [Armatimonadota bacterium]